MAEFVGIVASAVTLAEVVDKLPVIVRTIKRASRMNEDLMVLLNEITSLHGTVTFIEEVLSSNEVIAPITEGGSQHTAPQTPDVIESAARDLRRVVGDLERFAHSCQKASEDGEGLVKKAKGWKWMREHRHLAELRERVREMKMSLQFFIIPTVYQHQRFQTGLLFEIRDIVAHNVTVQEDSESVGSEATVVDEKKQDQPEMEADETPEHGDLGSQSSISTTLMVQRALREAESTSQDSSRSHVAIKGTYRKHCDISCPCNCHYSRTTRSTPHWMASVLGRFFLSYDCLPLIDPRTCNVSGCLNVGNLIELVWHLPHWAWTREICLAIQTGNAFGVNARISLAVPRVIPYSHPIWTPWGKQPDEWMLDLLGTDNISPIDHDESGKTLLCWSVTMPERLRFLGLILDYYEIRSGDDISQSQVGYNARKIYTENADELDDNDRSGLQRLIKITKETNKPLESKIHAAIRSSSRISKLVLLEGDVIDRWDFVGETPLTLACMLGDDDTTATLIHAGADINKKSSSDLTPLNCACFWGSIGCVEVLLSAGCDVNARGAFRPAIHELIWSLKASDETKEAILRLLAQHGADLSATSLFEDWPLQLSIYKDQHHVFKTLIELGADLTKYKAFNGWTLLHYLAAFGKLEFINSLRDAGPAAISRFSYGIKNKADMTPVDVFKCTMSDHGQLTTPGWRLPSEQEIAAFDDLMGRIRDKDLLELLAVLELVAQELTVNEQGTSPSVRDTLKDFIRKKWDTRHYEESERLRQYSVMIREGGELDALAEIMAWINEVKQTLSKSPLNTKSWVDDHQVVNEDTNEDPAVVGTQEVVLKLAKEDEDADTATDDSVSDEIWHSTESLL